MLIMSILVGKWSLINSIFITYIGKENKEERNNNISSLILRE